MAAIQAVKGMKDLLPGEIELWQKLEGELRSLMAQYGYGEIRMPVLEKTELFKRSIGEVTDIVEKEMYTFADPKNRSLSLRPEGTAQCVRAALEHGLLHRQTPRLWYYGPMFRYEQPQKFRYRQFYQLGVEAFGIQTPDLDAEQIIMMYALWQRLGLTDEVTLKINTLGTPSCRKAYREALVTYFEQHVDALDEDSKRRLNTNPLRILDSKNPAMADVIKGAPKVSDYLGEAAKAHFETLLALLDKADVPYQVEPTLVRGLDYYTLTVYEWVTDTLGAQGTVCGGGRYDGLVEMIGGKPTPACGFAIGIERLLGVLEGKGTFKAQPLDAYLVLVDSQAMAQGVVIAKQIRTQCPDLKMLAHCGEGSAKQQFKQADKSGALVALVVGEQELNQQQVTVKFLREDKDQQVVPMEQLGKFLAEHL